MSMLKCIKLTNELFLSSFGPKPSCLSAWTQKMLLSQCFLNVLSTKFLSLFNDGVYDKGE